MIPSSKKLPSSPLISRAAGPMTSTANGRGGAGGVARDEVDPVCEYGTADDALRRTGGAPRDKWRDAEAAARPDSSASTAEEEEAYSSWNFTDFGQVSDLSRDGSPHSTDEVINSATHLAASMLSLLGTSLLISASSAQGAPWKIVSFSIYGVSLMFLFICSTLHHCISGTPELEERLRMMDYLAIYPLIAGTFTPICLVFYHDSYIGWTFCSVVWSLAIMGMTGESFSPLCFLSLHYFLPHLLFQKKSNGHLLPLCPPPFPSRYHPLTLSPPTAFLAPPSWRNG